MKSTPRYVWYVAEIASLSCLLVIQSQDNAASLFIRKWKSVHLSFSLIKTLERVCKYPIRRVVCKTFTIPTGHLDATNEKLFTGQLPRRVVIGLVDNEAFNGAFGHNPFNLNISIYLKLLSIGRTATGIKPLAMKLAAHQFIHAYSDCLPVRERRIVTRATELVAPTLKTVTRYAFDWSWSGRRRSL